MNNETKTIKTTKRSKAVKKAIFTLTCMSVLTVCFSLVAFAAGEGFQNSAQTALTTVVNLIGGGLGAWGLFNLLEAYGSDNPGGNAHVR